ncbi:MAG TPA: hypothetical protein PLU43_12005, partial [Lachnospiraceae bacterium]|nr:hypothetical protein [Lachnospiraceae bacterium]
MRKQYDRRLYVPVIGLIVLGMSGCLYGCREKPDILSQEPVIPLIQREEEHNQEEYKQEDAGAAASSSLPLPETAGEDAANTVSSDMAGPAAVSSDTSTANIVSTQLSEEELESFSDYFNETRVNGFLSCSYEIPSWIDISAVLRSIGETGETVTAAEYHEIKESLGSPESANTVKYSLDYIDTL